MNTTPTAEQVDELLRHCDPGAERKIWVEIGMALHDWDDGEEGRSRWHGWSSRGATYNRVEAGAVPGNLELRRHIQEDALPRGKRHMGAGVLPDLPAPESPRLGADAAAAEKRRNPLAAARSQDSHFHRGCLA